MISPSGTFMLFNKSWEQGTVYMVDLMYRGLQHPTQQDYIHEMQILERNHGYYIILILYYYTVLILQAWVYSRLQSYCDYIFAIECGTGKTQLKNTWVKKV